MQIEGCMSGVVFVGYQLVHVTHYLLLVQFTSYVRKVRLAVHVLEGCAPGLL